MIFDNCIFNLVLFISYKIESVWIISLMLQHWDLKVEFLLQVLLSLLLAWLLLHLLFQIICIISVIAAYDFHFITSKFIEFVVICLIVWTDLMVRVRINMWKIGIYEVIWTRLLWMVKATCWHGLFHLLTIVSLSLFF